MLLFNEQDSLNILKVLTVANEFLIQELTDYLQEYLIKNKSEWMEQNFELTYRACFQSNGLSELQKFCTDLMAKTPEKFFTSLDSTLLPEGTLVSFIKKDDLQMKEVEVWDHVLNWGL